MQTSKSYNCVNMRFLSTLVLVVLIAVFVQVISADYPKCQHGEVEVVESIGRVRRCDCISGTWQCRELGRHIQPNFTIRMRPFISTPAPSLRRLNEPVTASNQLLSDNPPPGRPGRYYRR